MATWNDVRRIARTLPEAIEEPPRVWKVKKKLFAWERPLRKSDLKVLGDAAPAGAILGLRTDGLEMKEVLLRHDRGAFFTTPHFDGYPAVLVQLDNISTTELKDAMTDAWLAQAPERLATEFLAKRSGRR